MKRLLLSAAVLALCVSCAPPFNLDYSAAAVILGKMTKESQLGPLYNYYTGYYVSDPSFFPEKTASGVDTTRGFYVTTDIGGSVWSMGFVRPNSSGGYDSFDQMMGSLYHLDPNYPAYAVMPVKSGDTAAFTSYYASMANVQFEQPAVSTRSFVPIVGTPFVVNFPSFAFLPNPQVLGGFVYPSSSSTNTVYFLVQDASAPGSCYEAYATVDSVNGFVPLGGGPQTLNFLPAGTTRVLYYHDPSKSISYASFNTGGAWQCWKWWTDAQGFHDVQITGVTSRIDAVLTTGELFSTQDGTGRVYDSNGSQLTSFPLGNLKLAYEEYVNGAARVFFSMPIAESQDHISFAVYSIASSQLDSLKY